MRSLFLYSIAVAIFSILINIFLYIFIHQNHLKNFFESPIPDFLTLSSNSQVKLLDFWLPIIEKTEGSENGVPDFTAKAVLVYDLKTNNTLFERNAFERMPMASLTKIMTAIIALENKKSDDQYIVHKEDLVGEDSMGLEEGEILSLEELLYGLMLPSGNDAAEVIASNYPGGRTAFISAMNNKTRALGLENTVFSNPSGLQGDGVQHTTAYDLLVMTKYMLDNFPIMRKIVATYEYVIPKTATHKEYHLFNETNLLTTYPGVKGVKTGFTPEAGMCLISYLEYEDHKIIGILLNSKNRREEMKNFLDYSLKRLGITPPIHQ